MTTLYVERPSLRGAVVTAVVYVGGLLWTFLAADGPVTAASLWLIPVFGLVALPFFAVTFGKRRYNSITLTDGTLAVGRRRLSTQGLTVHPGPTPTGTPILGGSYGVPMGWGSIVVTGADGRNWRVATRRPEELTRALTEVTTRAAGHR